MPKIYEMLGREFVGGDILNNLGLGKTNNMHSKLNYLLHK